MKLLVLTDTHLHVGTMSSRHGDCSEIQRQKLRHVAEIANSSADMVVCCGDIFHSPRASFGEVLVWSHFRKRVHGLTSIVGIPGNHDGGRTALSTGAYSFLSDLRLIDDVTGEKDITGAGIRGLPYTVKSPSEYPECPTLLLHMQLGPFGTSLHDLASQVKSRLVIVGHNHSGYPTYIGKNALGEDCKIIAPGSLFRVSALEDEIRREIEVVIVDTETLVEERVLIPDIVDPSVAFDLDRVREQREREKQREEILSLPKVETSHIPTCGEIVEHVAETLGHGLEVVERVQDLVR
jgi:predicted phosphodiesterase